MSDMKQDQGLARTRFGIFGFCGGLAVGLAIATAQFQYGGSGSFLALQDTPALEYFLAPQSFSELDNAKRLLEAVANQNLIELRQRRMAFSLRTSGNALLPADIIEQQNSIQDLQEAIQRFGGTGQEHAFLRDLLLELKRAKMHDAWLEAYLELLYTQPAHAMTGRFAADAVRISQAAGRYGELLSACAHLAQIPFNFEAKQLAASEIAKAGIHSQLSQVRSQ
jgi:hypothetical protein